MANVITLEGGDVVISASLDGGDIYPSGGSGGNLQAKSVSYTPTEVSVSDHLTPSAGYDGFSYVDVSIDGIPSNYIGSSVPLLNSSSIIANLTDNSLMQKNSVTVPQGYFGANTTKTDAFPNMATTNATSASIDGSGDLSVTFSPSTAGMAYTNKSYSLAKSGFVTPRSSSDLSASGATVTAPAGYYASSATKTIPDASTPTIDSRSVDSSGYVTVDIEIDNGGYIGTGTYEATDSVPLPTQAAQTITPGTTDQTIASGKYLTGTQTILGDADLVASNIKKDVSIFGVTGTYEGGGGGSGMALSDFVARTLRNEDRAVVLTGNTADFLKGMFFRWTNITSFKSLSSSASIGNATYCFADCTDLKTIVLPNITAQTMSSSSMCFAQKSTALEAVDVSFGFYNYSFDGCSSLDTVVLRRSGVTTLGNINAFNGTPFASGGTGGTLYVPNDLLASYQSASNWSTILGYANNQIKSIESTHTDPTAPIDLTLYYADGTAI